MDFQTKKLTFIQEILALGNEKLIDKLMYFLNYEKMKKDKKYSAHNFLGVLTEEEAESMKKEIEEACENINDEDWE